MAWTTIPSSDCSDLGGAPAPRLSSHLERRHRVMAHAARAAKPTGAGMV